MDNIYVQIVGSQQEAAPHTGTQVARHIILSLVSQNARLLVHFELSARRANMIILLCILHIIHNMSELTDVDGFSLNSWTYEFDRNPR